MFWPRFKLTPDEMRKGSVKYSEPGKRGVLRRIYTGFLATTQTQRQAQFNFQIARRCRVMGLTAAGDVHQFRVQMKDTSGEEYFAEPITFATLLGGYVDVPPPGYGAANVGNTGGFPYPGGAAPLVYAAAQGMPFSSNPLIFEPNIVLASNQTLNIIGTPVQDYAGIDYRVDMCIHVYEFPDWEGNGPD